MGEPHDNKDAQDLGSEAIEGELVEETGEDEALDSPSTGEVAPYSGTPAETSDNGSQFSWRVYLLLPLMFLTVGLLGGLRISTEGAEFVFIRPALICLIFATMVVVLFLRNGLIELAGWFSESMSGTQNAANSVVLLSLFGASVQVFNSLLPERGLPFWIFSFCFLWILTVSFFNVGGARQLVRTVAAMFSIAFVSKYFVLLSLTSESGGNWLQRMWEDPTRETFTYLLDLPRFAPATGYIQFLAVGLFVVGLLLLPVRTDRGE